MNSPLIKTFLALTAFIAVTGVSRSASFTLANTDASIMWGNSSSSFYETTGNGMDSGSSAASYSSTRTGNALTGFAVTISFGGNAQPVLTSAFIDSGPVTLYWDSNDLAGFNSGIFDSIVLKEGGLFAPPFTSVLGISKAGLSGVETHKVPDGGATALLLGISLIGLAWVAQRLRPMSL